MKNAETWRLLEDKVGKALERELAAMAAFAFQWRALTDSSSCWLTMASPKSRIAEMLFRPSGSYGVQQGGHIVIETRLSHEQIAALVGVTRVTVTRAMQELTAAGILKVEGSSIQILDTQKLHEFSIF